MCSATGVSRGGHRTDSNYICSYVNTLLIQCDRSLVKSESPNISSSPRMVRFPIILMVRYIILYHRSYDSYFRERGDGGAQVRDSILTIDIRL